MRLAYAFAVFLFTLAPGAASEDISGNTATRSASVADGVAQMKKISRSLRGHGMNDADPAAVISDLNDAVTSQLAKLKPMQQMHQNGDVDGLARAMKASLGTLVDESVVKTEDLSGGFAFQDIDLDGIPKDQLAKLYQPEVFDQFVKQMEDLTKTLKDTESLFASPGHHPSRKLKDVGGSDFSESDIHSFDFLSNGGFSSGALPKGQSTFQPWAPFDNQRARHLNRRMKNRGDNLRSGAHGGTRRRLEDEVSAKHNRRIQANEVCRPRCEPSDNSCRCEKLVGCVDDMTDYDIALTFVRGYIETDPSKDNFANFTILPSELNLFDADADIHEKIRRIREKRSSIETIANENVRVLQCSHLLEEFHSACDPSVESCSGPNSHSFQLSLEDVCDAVNTPVKLSFSAILDEMDESLDGSVLDEDHLSMSSCGEFAREFDRLYDSRDETEYPDLNPMRRFLHKDPPASTQAAIYNKDTRVMDFFPYTKFPTEYHVPISEQHGVPIPEKGEFQPYSERAHFKFRDALTKMVRVQRYEEDECVSLGLDDVQVFAIVNGVEQDVASSSMGAIASQSCQSGNGWYPYSQVELNKGYEITRVVIWNRQGTDHLSGTVVALYWREDWGPEAEMPIIGDTTGVANFTFSRPEKEAMKACDRSMSLLLGNFTSVGTLRAIADLVEEKGPDRMPGKCCLDRATETEYFGYQYDPELGMECYDKGYWHFGISPDVCEDVAGGRWFRTPCVTLQECVNDRPESGTDAFSKAFEDMVVSKNLMISNSDDEEQCRHVRQELGFEADHPFDTEVCQKFQEYMCDPLFTEVDAMSEELEKPPEFTPIEYEDIEYPEDDDLTFTKLPQRDAYDEPKFGEKSAALSDLHKRWLDAADDLQKTEIFQGFIVDTFSATCDFIPDSVTVMGVGVPNPLYLACTYAAIVLYVIAEWIVSVKLWNYQVLNRKYEEETLGAGDAIDGHLYSKTLWEQFKVSDQWSHKALGIMNVNIMTQHTEMREHLQERHETMVNDINGYTETAVNQIGGYVDELGSSIHTQHTDMMEHLQTRHDEIVELIAGTQNRARNLIEAGQDFKEAEVADSGVSPDIWQKSIEAKVDTIEGKVNEVEGKVDALSSDLKTLIELIGGKKSNY